jgi:hypothetical protein
MMRIITEPLGFLARVVDLPSWSQALLAALAGAAIAWAYFFGDPTQGGRTFLIAAGIAVGVMVVAWLSYRIGALVVRRQPLLGVRLMGLWAWLELAGGALGIAIGIWLAATVVPKEKEPNEETKAVVSGWAAGLSAAIATALSKRAEDADDRVASRVEKVVKSAFKGRFAENSVPWNLVESDPYLTMDGWGRDAREERARRLEAVLKAARRRDDSVI